MSVDWFKYDKEKSSYVFNHRSEDETDMNLREPVPMNDAQRKAWSGARWYKELVEF